MSTVIAQGPIPRARKGYMRKVIKIFHGALTSAKSIIKCTHLYTVKKNTILILKCIRNNPTQTNLQDEEKQTKT